MGRRGVCQSPEKAPRPRVMGTPSASAFHEKIQVDPRFLDDNIALRAMDRNLKYSLLVCVRLKDYLQAWGNFARSWIAVSGRPKTVQMDSDEGKENETLADFWTGRNVRLQFQGKDAHPWLLPRRIGLARGIYGRLAGYGRFSIRAILDGRRAESWWVFGIPDGTVAQSGGAVMVA